MPFSIKVKVSLGEYLSQIVFRTQLNKERIFHVNLEFNKFLFHKKILGVDMIRPWGCVQRYCCNLTRYRNKLKKELSTIPFVDPSNVNEIQDRLYAL
ncbi:15569_t:CDS:2 [Funneliformis caledonium]|uniref:15569_t:CDS:1 n=1 Tax=Funneliformis caledonium TaxID=1117310 RepID=A0A9N8ZZA9_9GLOM|nr:15569_t:CDS:2 [Funneliformis caledonium]